MQSHAKALVSCLCVTRGKPAKLKRAIGCFLAQRYVPKELVVIYEDDDLATRELVIAMEKQWPHLIVGYEICSVPKLPLGELRNIAVRKARGEYFCQWDDDDWYHYDRIAMQVEAVSSSHRQACMLTNWIIYDEIGLQAYTSHFRLWEGTLLCKTDVIDAEVKYPQLTRDEDNVLASLLIARGYVFPLVALGLYIYTAHASNTWPREHFLKMFSFCQPLSNRATNLIADILQDRHTVEQSSKLMRSELLLKEVSYFPGYSINN